MDKMAKLGLNSGVGFQLVESPPQDLKPLLMADALGVEFLVL